MMESATGSLEKRAEQLLLAAGMDILSGEEIDLWNAGRNDGAEPQREVNLAGWEECDAGILVKEFYVRSSDPDVTGIYRKAWVYHDDGEIYDFFITDYDQREVEIRPQGDN